MARFGDGFLDCETVSSVAARVIEHVEIRRRREEAVRRSFWSSGLVILFDYNPLRISGEWVLSELEDALARLRAHGSSSDGP